MPTDFTSKSLSWTEATETITVTRRTPNATTPTIDDITTIYSGAADVQSADGTLAFNPAGIAPEFDAWAAIDPVAGVIPAIQSGDILAVTGGDTFTVVTTEVWNFAPKHLELKLRKGGNTYGNTPR